jgi:tRNA (mo5U34)-methyltransferase
MLDFSQLLKDTQSTPMAHFIKPLIEAVEHKLKQYTHGELEQWQQLINSLPEITSTSFDLEKSVTIGTANDLVEHLDQESTDAFIHQLKTLHPWRKGPFNLFGINIDTEWRSDWKWERLLPHIADLKGRTILDVGCGNGYHCWRMLGQQAKLVLGIDPSQKFLAQFSIIKKYLGTLPVHLLPLGIEDMPTEIANHGFDSVFSMGVLYHRKSPISHLYELKNLLAPNGELILETLVVDGDVNTVLLPQGRYAQMRNVWFLPSTAALENWLQKCGFKNIRTIDVNQTSLEEQRSTEWMHFHSLKNYLDPVNINLTIEGHPAPKRAIIIANK